MKSLEEYPIHGSTCTMRSRYRNLHHSLGGNSSGCWLSIANSLQIFQAPAEPVHMDYLLVLNIITAI